MWQHACSQESIDAGTIQGHQCIFLQTDDLHFPATSSLETSEPNKDKNIHVVIDVYRQGSTYLVAVARAKALPNIYC